MHQYQTDAEAVEQGDILNQLKEAWGLHQFAAEGDDNGASAVCIDIGGGTTELAGKGGGWGLRSWRAASLFRCSFFCCRIFWGCGHGREVCCCVK